MARIDFAAAPALGVNAPPPRGLVKFTDRIDLAAHHAAATTAVGNQLGKLEATPGSIGPNSLGMSIVVIEHFAHSYASPKHGMVGSPQCLGFLHLTV
jgi:hypothetical protein